ncbi:hypothetical protein KIN20_023775 [Parelaphostrongylus tenuis]|uniref:Uncharacterized protein n=1 Tax=Parelaphostrongylus tenuis TaxID=148309 RepID=A0AAD5MXH1_PARTN|nr:hypothetical protein KIN20_023775 [Parelaphostrongylus tenuis]
MKTLVVAFILIAGSNFSSQFGHISDNIAECGDDANMNKMLRLTVRELHNSQRNLLAKETEENGSETTIGKLLNISAMRPLKYDCRLEESAFNISEMCRNESHA